MKRNRIGALVLGGALLAALLLCSACQKEEPLTLEEEVQSLVDMNAGARETTGKLAVLKEESTLKSRYSYTTGEDGAFLRWMEIPGGMRMNKNDLVLVLDQGRTLARVYLPYGAIPGTYGLLPAKALDFREEAVRKSNQVWARETPAYDKREGTQVETLTGAVQILGRNGNWCQVRCLSGGDDRLYWARAENLTVQFPTTVPDQAAQ